MISNRVSKKYKHLKEKEIKKPEEFIREYRTKTKSYQHLKKRIQKVKKTGGKVVEGSHKQKLLLVLRIRGIDNLS